MFQPGLKNAAGADRFSGTTRVFIVAALTVLFLLPLVPHVTGNGGGTHNLAIATTSKQGGYDEPNRTDPGAATRADADCPAGTFCAWGAADFGGTSGNLEMAAMELETCTALPTARAANSFVNQTGHPVTVYADANCGSEQDFATYPSGAQAPRAEYPARAIQVWEH